MNISLCDKKNLLFIKKGSLNGAVAILKCSYELPDVIQPDIILYIKILYVLFYNERAKNHLL